MAIVSQCLVTGFENKLLWDLVPVSCFPCSISQATDCSSRLESPQAPLFLPSRAKYAARGQNPPLLPSAGPLPSPPVRALGSSPAHRCQTGRTGPGDLTPFGVPKPGAFPMGMQHRLLSQVHSWGNEIRRAGLP